MKEEKKRSHVTLIKVIIFILLASVCVFAGPKPVQTYYVPLAADHLDTSFDILGGSGNQIRNVISIVPNSSSTILYYDHWEDDFEPDISNPTQATTQVWGDNNPTNGIPPGFSVDLVGPGDIITLINNVVVPRNPNVIFYDGGDKVAVSKPIALSFSGWPVNTGPVLADGVEVYDTTSFGTNFYAPVGPNVASFLFKYSSVLVMAMEDDTFISIDTNGDGSTDVTNMLAEGGSYQVNGGVNGGARVTSDKPVQVQMITGQNDNEYLYECRWFTLFPHELWSDTYFMPVGETDDDYPVGVFLYNSAASPVVVNFETDSGSSFETIPGDDTILVYMPPDSGARISSTNGSPFEAIATMDTTNTREAGRMYDWGATLPPESVLTPHLLVGWGAGSSDLSKNGSPIWVTAASNTLLFVDFDGDPTTGPLIDGSGNHYDTNFPMILLQSIRVFDTSGDNDQSGMRLYTTNEVKIMAMWGEDPDNASRGNPYLDIGSAVLPVPSYAGSKSIEVVNDIYPNGRLDPGETGRYTIALHNAGQVEIKSVAIKDSFPASMTYVSGSTKTNGVSIPDAISGTPFPLDGPGIAFGDLLPEKEIVFTFKIVLDDPFPLGIPAIYNTAKFTTVGAGKFEFSDVTAVEQSDISVAKVVDDDNPYLSNNVVYSVLVTNWGTANATGLEVKDILPPGVIYVSHSGGSYDSVSGLWTIGALSASNSATLEITALVGAVGTFTNSAAVYFCDQYDPDTSDNADEVVITVKASLPFVDITNSNATVTYDVTNYTIGGTNNIHVVGVMNWVNSLGGSGTLPAATPWEISSIGLSVGANVITVTGTNVFGDPASDSVTITRGGIGTGAPFVDVTNAPATVTYDVTSYTIGGTNNIHVVGVMSWVNSLGGSGILPAATPWEIS
ncbi:MAG: DUF11 domain-containing protein, partial [Planctomycetes bacterium]|nr:DUF11 domain-containing protein [Planctomycetota bacterium]